ncbi:hypothetical protein E2L08_10180 [Palleronia sediminis]|uniref:Uncharacterized protein n=1 Tax=Palleronia sediminis TaxID=2547833 RepID=A0A4R6ADV5_9RHOB|nr:hypothetical protein [Palleronia sediminis]TDL79383.1 hypothetical protein E2L08_10180 [Palleronia sediminis]
MTYGFNELTGLRALIAGDEVPVSDLLIERAGWRVRRVALDVGSWFESRHALVSIDRFEAPRDDGWPARFSEDELRDAPAWEDHATSEMDLPPLIVGPFGMTVSPLMMSAGLKASMARSLPPEVVETPEGAPLRSARGFLGIEIFGDSGSRGTVEDLRIDDTWSVTHIVTDDGDPIPVDALRETDQGNFVIG